MTDERESDRLRKVRRRARAVVLLQRILAIRPLSIDAVAEALVVSRAVLHDYLSGKVPVPLERQLCLDGECPGPRGARGGPFWGPLLPAKADISG